MSLDQKTANERFALVRGGSIRYNFNLILMPTQYYGLAELTFYLENLNFDTLKIDFQGKIIEQIVVNSVKIPPNGTKNFLNFRKIYLQKGKNKISIMYTNEYDNDRLGCCTFKDKDLQYVYTHFQPYGAHRVFPCFDQPNLKAEMKLSVVTPTDWVAFSNQPEEFIEKFDKEIFKKHTRFEHAASGDLLEVFLDRVGDNTHMTMFEYTPLISTYVFAMAAGPYAFIEADQGEGDVPMRAICATSSIFMLEAYASFIFDVTKKSMKYYQKLFGQLYPFEKYDLIWVREYENWAMENAGLVTFSEDKTLKTYPTEQDYYDLADTLAHELAHHWFGNLVTMNWWDDLWLNQSFADFISQYTLGKINGQLIHPLDPAAMYFRDRKAWGYQEDERSTATHAIRGTVEDTDVAASIFDGITYAKGAAVMKQLMFLVGEENFSAGLKNYFDRFSWGNATIDDFLQDLEPFFPSAIVSLEVWKTTWLETPSLNVFEAIWDPASTSSTATLSLYQSAFTPKYSTLRCHQIQVAFFDASAAIIDTKTVLIPPNAAMTTVTYDGSKNVQAILVNYNDQSFLQNYLDPQSLLFFTKNISDVQDDFTRALIWYTIAQMSKQTLMRLDDYTTFIIDNLFDEPMDFVVNRLLAQLLTFLKDYTSDEEMSAQSNLVFDAIYEQLKGEAVTSFDRVTVLEQHFISYAQNDYQYLRLKDFLMKVDPSLVTRIILDQDLPWQIVKKVFAASDEALTVAQKEEVFAFALQLDSSSRSEDARVICDTILLNTEEQIAALYQKLTQDTGDLTLKYLLIEGWKSKYHQDLTAKYEQNYFHDLVPSKGLSYAFFELFYNELRPASKDFSYQITEFNKILDQLRQDSSMTAHVANISKIVDDLGLQMTNLAFNSDSDLNLTKDRATTRYSYIRGGSISYISHIGFVSLEESQEYSGLTELTFELTSLPKLLPIDFVSSSISDLVVNGYNVAPLLHGEFLLIPRIYLKLGVNNIAVNYSNHFNNDGLGCLSFIDPSGAGDTSKYYVYTQFEPYSAHRLIPCFDQPDLKATLSLNVILPSDWVSVANGPQNYTAVYDEIDYVKHAPSQNQDLLVSKYLKGKSGSFFIFDQTKSISTYLYCLVAGHYYSVDLAAAERYNDIPMSIYCLDSYKEALDRNKDFIFEMNKLSLEFFEGKFNVLYQFPKYDTVFCHEFSAGAMENPGIITFNDTYLYQEIVSVDKMVQLGVVIAHQCAHNWFGDYVTMKWWDDLWLNESFADFMAYFCIEGIKDKVTTIPTYTTGWIGGVARVVGGYREDQMSTTHPIRSEVPNTSLATVYFDNITYRKGLSTLKQLMFLMGETNFFLGVTAYFNEFKWSNATIDNFLTHMNVFYIPPVPEYTLELWKQTWLLTASLNVLTAAWESTSVDPKATLTIKQTAFSADYPILRYHMINVAFFYTDGSYSTQKVLVLNIDETTLTYDASKGVKAVLLNQDIQDFVKYDIDATSLAFFQGSINTINKGDVAEDAVTRMIIWFYMNEMTRDAKIKVFDYRDVIINSISAETQDGIYQFELAFLNECTGSYIAMAQRPALRTDIFTFLIQQLVNFKPAQEKEIKEKEYNTRVPKSRYPIQMYKNKGNKQISNKFVTDTQNRIKILKDYLPVFCSNDDQIDILNQWRLGTYPDLATYPITLSQAWTVVKMVYTSSHFTSDQQTAVYDDQNSKTPGLMALLTLNTVMALSAKADSFEVIYQVFRETLQSLTVKASYSEGWNNPIHLDWLMDIYKARYFQDILNLSTTLPDAHFQFFYTYLKPIDDDLQVNISLFESIDLPGSAMIGHMNNIKKITDGLKLKDLLYRFNSLFIKK